MNPEHTIIIIPFICGAVFGVIAAFLAARPHIKERIARVQKATWAEAMRFYANKQREAGR